MTAAIDEASMTVKFATTTAAAPLQHSAAAMPRAAVAGTGSTKPRKLNN